MRGTTNKTTGTAVSRAIRIWGECALYARGTVRQQRGRGPLKQLDEIASGRRGAAVPKGIAAVAMEMAAAGVPAVEIKAQLGRTMDRMIDSITRQSYEPPKSA